MEGWVFLVQAEDGRRGAQGSRGLGDGDKRQDQTRAEGYICTCTVNTRDFTCRHSLGVAMMLKIVVPPNVAGQQLIGRKRKPGRPHLVPAAWEFQVLDIDSPVHHAPQDRNILMGIEQEPRIRLNDLNDQD